VMLLPLQGQYLYSYDLLARALHLERDVLNEGEVGIKERQALRRGSVCFRTLASVLETHSCIPTNSSCLLTCVNCVVHVKHPLT
jgi:hypothetical protein